jgi:hypothetical protein
VTAGFHDPSYFRAQYASSDDPWGFDDRWYERRKYALTLAMLPRPRYASAFEPGCANGALTELLQERCDRLVACELLPEVARRAATRLEGSDHVDVHCAAFPDWWPESDLDLLVLSEVAYYLTADGRRRAERSMADALLPGADLVAVHYTGETDYPMHGDEVARWLDGLPWLDRLAGHVDREFEGGIWRRRPDPARGVHHETPGWVVTGMSNTPMSDDDITRNGPTEDDENLDAPDEHFRDTGDESDGPTEDDENRDAPGEHSQDTGDEA